MRYRHSVIAALAASSAIAWIPGTAAAAPLGATVMHLAEKARMGVQSVTVKGQLFCADQPSSSKESTVRLVNKRVSQDDARTAFPAADGTFMVTLQVDRLTTMSPEIHVYTACATTTPCQRRIRFPVPDKYINSQTPYDLGTVHLEAKQSDEEPVC